MAEFSSNVRHVAGVDNVVADTMSRPPLAALAACAVPATAGSLDWAALAAEQRSCPSVEEAAKNTYLQLQLVPFGDVRVLCDVGSGHQSPARASS